MSTRSQALLALIIASVLWGTSGVAAKILVRDVSPFVSSFYRFAIASLIILPFFLRERKPLRAWRTLLPLSLLGGLNVPLFFWGVQTTTANSAALIYTITPLMTALFSYLLISERHTRQKIIGIMIGLIGAIFIVILPTIEKGAVTTGSFGGNMLVVAAMLSWTLYTVGSRHFLGTNRFSPLTVTAILFFSCTGISLMLSLITGQDLLPLPAFKPDYLLTLIYSGIFLTLVTYFLFQWAVKRISVTTASLKQYIELIIGIVSNMLILGEQLTLGFMIGSVLVVAGVGIATGGRIIAEVKAKFLRI